jgi:hypothetical protein
MLVVRGFKIVSLVVLEVRMFGDRCSRQLVRLLGRVISPSGGRYLHRTTQTQKKRGQTSMPRVGFEFTIPVFERAKIFV